MNYLIRMLFQAKIEFHTQRIRQYRRAGEKLLQTGDGLCSPRLVRLNRVIDHHGCLLHPLEQRLNIAA